MVEIDPDRADRPRRPGHAARRLRRAQATHRVLLHVAPRPSRSRAMRRLYVEHHPGQRAVVPAFARHHLRRPRRDEGGCQGPYDESLATGTSWAGTCRGIRPRPTSTHSSSGDRSARCTSCATSERATGCSRPTGQPPRRRGRGLQLRADGSDRLRASGAMGGLTTGWPQRCTTPARPPVLLTGRPCRTGRAAAPFRSGRDWKPAAPTTSPPGRPDRGGGPGAPPSRAGPGAPSVAWTTGSGRKAGRMWPPTY